MPSLQSPPAQVDLGAVLGTCPPLAIGITAGFRPPTELEMPLIERALVNTEQPGAPRPLHQHLGPLRGWQPSPRRHVFIYTSELGSEADFADWGFLAHGGHLPVSAVRYARGRPAPA